MPVAFLRPFGQGGFAPLARPRFILGSDLDSDLVDTAEGVAEHHATVRLQRGEYVLVAEEGCSLWMDGRRVPLISLRDGDTLSLAPGATPWRFRSRVEGSFWPPEFSVGEAWLSHPAYKQRGNGPERYGDGRPIRERDPDRSRVVLGPHGPLIVKRLARVATPKAATHYLRFLTALGGAVHPALAPIVDGGIAPRDGHPARWLATRYVDGVRVRDLLVPGPLEPGRALRILRSLSTGVAHLHHRGITHRSISLGNVVVPPTNLAVLIDFGRAHSIENPIAPPPDRHEPAGFAAPEIAAGGSAALAPAVDVYALAAFGTALLTGLPGDAEDYDPSRALADAPRLAGGTHDAWVPVLRAGLDPHPSRRPTAAAVAAALHSAEQLGLARSS